MIILKKIHTMNEIKIYSRNIFGVPFFARQHKMRIDKIVEQAKLARADILLLQEVFLPGDRKELERCFGNEFNIYQAKNGFLKLGGGLCGLFRKGIKTENHYIAFNSSGFLSDLTIVDKIAKKGFQVFKIHSPFKITLINTHLTCPYEKNIDSDKKMKKMMQDQIFSIKKYLDREAENPLMICGDFNLESTQDIMKNFINGAGLDNRSDHLHNTILGNFYFPKWLFRSIPNEKKPDYILTRNIPQKWRITVKRASDHHELISDHIGIITTIEF